VVPEDIAMTAAVLPAAAFREPLSIRLAESGLLPDALIRSGIRRLLAGRAAELAAGGVEAQREREAAFVERLRRAPLAVEQTAANQQHYEVPPEFFGLALGPQRKYSSCHYSGDHDLAGAEERALAATAVRAGLADGQRILELGCGWGSLSLWMARRFPQARITAVSNSAPQRRHIAAVAEREGLANLTVLTRDIAAFDPGTRFDRVVSVECFEHLRNWAELFRRISTWLEPGGALFFHVFTHRHSSYLFQADGEDDWMGRHFFTGGMMPADDLPLRLQDDLRVTGHWRWSGLHYARTARAWLENLDRHRRQAAAILGAARPDVAPAVLVQRWRIFFMACEELWRHRGGEEWLVSHYRMERP
jgi:cyclopropane-fatty-acyl-phospholipid synthase